MKLTRLRINQFRQFRVPLEIPEFRPGLNLFCGPNESGKSTIAGAIRAAFFERHRSSSVDDLRPWGDSGAAPEVELDFECDGQPWRLKKRFLTRKRCDLNIGGEVLSGDEAEDRLARMFGYQQPAKGASKPAFWGIPGLLWVEQGTGHDLRAPVAFAGEHIKSVLAATLGEVASTGGDDILQRVESELNELVTAKTDRPKGRFKEYGDKAEQLKTDLAALDLRIETYRQQVDRLGELSQRQAKEQAERPWEALREQQQRAEGRYQEVQQLSERQAQDQMALERCRNHLQVVLDRLQGFQLQASELLQRDQAKRVVQARLDDFLAQQNAVKGALQSADSLYKQARETDRLSRLAQRRRELQQQKREMEGRRTHLTQSLIQARALEKDLSREEAALAECCLDEVQLKVLERLSESQRDLSITQQSVATLLRFDLEPGQHIDLDGVRLEGQGEKRLLQGSDIHVHGVGRLHVSPGGKDLHELARQLEYATERLSAALAAAGTGSIEQARERAEATRSLQSTLSANRKLLALHAPQGGPALEQELTVTAQLLGKVDEQLEAIGDLDSSNLPDPQMAEQTMEHAATRLAEAERAERQLREQLIQNQQALNHAHEEYLNAQASLAKPERRQQEEQCHSTLASLRVEQAQLTQAIAQRALLIDEARPDILLQDIKRYQSSASQLELANRQRSDELVGLQAQLQAQDAEGLEERRAQRAAEFENWSRRHQQLERRTRALKLLAGLLTDKRQALTRQLQAPLQKHLNHYLQLLFPQAVLEVDEHLVPGQLVRLNQESGDFDALSFGAREQMGLISRLAYADLLKEAGRPTLIILDDALVHSDQHRFAQMKRILFDASQRHQVLLFTCHPDNWLDMGVPMREIHSYH
ncbi:MAG TPA: GTP-binding protein [Pseudomonas xinjiangensis]|uniref:GTP-binding protein n=2 Tax=root TaxID=1 RepID=A0A7V1BMP9_9GAMM|nr:GTP-binding protein [Halopseudomonas xinjiangensis]HEC49023.1 GTP-binding protein [Halopseudomonas xinjiangensis]